MNEKNIIHDFVSAITAHLRFRQAAFCLVLTILVLAVQTGAAEEGEEAVEREYAFTPPAPAGQTAEQAEEKSAGCMSCHTETDSKSMHASPAIQLGCTDCHGGNSAVFVNVGASRESDGYMQALERAHVLPRYPESWHFPHSANPERTYTLLNRESNEFIRFMNPSDFRVADKACGACHQDIIEASKRSMHATGAMLWGGASYNNGILPFKNYILGESYGEDGSAQAIYGPRIPEAQQQAAADAGILPVLYPLPPWESVNPADVFRVFERGGRNISNLFPETGLPNALGQLQRIEEPGRPDFRQSNRGPGTGARIAVPVINITKTRLNDPFLWFVGTNDQPGDYRQSGCASCHSVYANDRDPRHSGPYAGFGHVGQSQTIDPTISKTESGHPLQHTFTRAIPTSQCMVCHMHQPNMFMNTYLGYTMWDYESDAPMMWPEEQAYPTSEEMREILDRNPEGAAVRGKWADVDFLEKVSELNPQLNDTQFADYHGHGWNFRAVFKRDRKGNLLDAEGDIVEDDDPEKFDKAVHMSSIHVDAGMHCVDCHFSQDNHGNGYIHGEVALAVEIDCVDCHGTAQSYPNLYTSGPAALDGGTDLEALRTPDGRLRFEWVGNELYQRSMLEPELEWRMSLVKDTVSEEHADYNATAARAKLMSSNTVSQEWGLDVPYDQLAHGDEEVECYTCHTSWTTSCGGCHLPIEANWKTDRHHYEGGESRNYATYNPQVARDQMFLIGKRSDANGGRTAPIRSTSALVLSSTNANRERIYVQQAPVSSGGYSSQAFNPHFPHTTRKTETKTCSDCHVSVENDNNAIMAQLLAQGTNFINLVGFNVYHGGDGEVGAVVVTEWDEPQAVIGSYLQKYAYPDHFRDHREAGLELDEGYSHSTGTAQCIQLRGEYLYVAEGRRGLNVYDVAGIANKGVSQRIITAPFSEVGQDVQVESANATCMALPTNQPISPERNEDIVTNMPENLESPMHPLYNYAFVVDSEEGLILVDVNTLQDGEPRNNHLERALTWNANGVLDGARHITAGGSYLYVTTDEGVVIVDIDQPMSPRHVATVPVSDARATALQFRYLFVTSAAGLSVIDVTNPESPRLSQDNTVALADARKVFIARTYAYVAAGRDGVVIVDVERPEAMRELTRFNADGRLTDANDIVVASTNATLFGYVADGEAGIKVVQLTAPDTQPKFYGFSPEPRPELIAWYETDKPALSLSRGLERDRAVDETGNQVAVFGRRGSRPLNKEEMQKMYLDDDGRVWSVSDDAAEPGDTSER